jgi:hypothetical protein
MESVPRAGRTARQRPRRRAALDVVEPRSLDEATRPGAQRAAAHRPELRSSGRLRTNGAAPMAKCGRSTVVRRLGGAQDPQCGLRLRTGHNETMRTNDDVSHDRYRSAAGPCNVRFGRDRRSEARADGPGDEIPSGSPRSVRRANRERVFRLLRRPVCPITNFLNRGPDNV